ncbi:hypothetical protein [Saccharospirillum salsuginis]|uniref:Outer membrane protein beta-barrel domain-containing protein n=1 Tax=Saccharospirillum salsuginis TaxID=418750 RepID=A0A918KV99_9GAMM|nr:hypothetical protein [Saccharospirillum salsuginis]GGX74820.1 hypothetical protein GCM10007392_47620 [Saccharospirillum salsuginis]
MPRKLLALSIASGLCALNAHALEWDDAYNVASAGVFYAAQPSDSSYPSSFGLGLTGAYHLPLFVEGHHKVIAQGHYGYYRPRPEAELGKQGSTNHGFSLELLLMRDAEFASNRFWWGGGITRQATYVTDHYEWQIKNKKWALEQFDDEWQFSSSLLLSIQYPISSQLDIETLLAISISDTPSTISLKAGYRF